jgi:hypothetical protein
MDNLKAESIKNCFSLLRGFIEEVQVLADQKGIAILALNHLQKIMAGTDPPPGSSLASCVDTPRIDGVPPG